tara:strand:+ start:1393 stop:1938 length:546 start_codon:yes stop_codon:yes gene_type:complete
MASEANSNILPVLKTAAPDPNIFSEPTVFKEAKSDNNIFFYVKIFLLVLLIVLLGLNMYFYFTEDVTLYTKLFGSNELAEEQQQETKDPTELALDEKKHEDEYKPSNLEKALDEPRKKDEPTPSPDLSNEADLQLAKKAGYCYVGTLNKKRTCIEIDEDDKCMSGDIFPTRDLCVNPNLRK